MGAESYSDYFRHATDEEIIQFFSVFTDKERNGEFANMFGLINCVLSRRDGDKYVHNYFLFRDLFIKEVDTSLLAAALDKLIATNEKAWKEYTGGKEQAVGRFIGQLAKATGVTPQDAKAYIESRKTT